MSPEMTGLTVSCIGLVMGVAIALVVFLLVYPPMRKLLAVNTTLEAAQSFYGRTFLIIMLLVTWAAVLHMDLSAPAPGSAATQPTTRPHESPALMECVWKVADNLERLIWPILIVLAGYVVLLSLVFIVLGRYREQ